MDKGVGEGSKSGSHEGLATEREETVGLSLCGDHVDASQMLGDFNGDGAFVEGIVVGMDLEVEVMGDGEGGPALLNIAARGSGGGFGVGFIFIEEEGAQLVLFQQLEVCSPLQDHVSRDRVNGIISYSHAIAGGCQRKGSRKVAAGNYLVGLVIISKFNIFTVQIGSGRKAHSIEIGNSRNRRERRGSPIRQKHQIFLRAPVLSHHTINLRAARGPPVLPQETHGHILSLAVGPHPLCGPPYVTLCITALLRPNEVETAITPFSVHGRLRRLTQGHRHRPARSNRPRRGAHVRDGHLVQSEVG
mmetsp:Transcript_14892/g.33055  ORF Transcript_14892/g.33055 Transcript_14892/m.33055 type:complete len:303 (+) Transcript_14892:3365-4273(+)